MTVMRMENFKMRALKSSPVDVQSRSRVGSKSFKKASPYGCESLISWNKQAFRAANFIQ